MNRRGERVIVAALRDAIARHPIAAFLIIGIAANVAAALTPGLNDVELPFGAPLFGFVGGFLGVGLAAFVVTAAADGRPGVEDLARRTLRWRVPVRWWLLALFGVPVAATLVALAVYGGEALEAPDGGWPGALVDVLVVFVLQLLLFQLAEEIGWTGFLQERLWDRYTGLKLSALVALPWAVWHLPDFFADEGWTLESLAVAPIFLVFEFVSLFFARVLFVWLYDRALHSVLIVAVMHASFDASISELSDDIVPGSDTARLLILSGVIVGAAVAIIVATRGRIKSSAQPPIP